MKHCGSNFTKKVTGFTLAELLIALAVLGIIAAFTIPKLLTATNNTRYSAITKEAVGTISEAYLNYKSTNTVTTTFSTKFTLAPYIHYAYVLPAGWQFNHWGNNMTSQTCGSNGLDCYMLHNGALLALTGCQFTELTPNGTATFWVDPTGQYDDIQAIGFALHYNGRIESYGQVGPPSVSTSDCIPASASSSRDPVWFSWN